MAKKNQVLEASEERIYLLDKLSVPPKNYGMFLVDIVKSFEGFVLKEGKADSLEELAEKHRNRLIKLNPDKPKGEFSQTSAISLAVHSELQFDKGYKNKRISEKPYRSTKYTESLFSPYSEFISLEDYKNSILNYVKEFKEKLNQRYPKRQGQLSNNLSSRKSVGNGIYNFIRGFELKLRLYSDAIYLLEGDVSLIDHGSTSKNIIEWYCTPAIRVRARGFGNASVIKRFVESLGSKVQKTYAFDKIVSSSTYEFSK